jgi:prepilin-type processing-associated H-X9-DG protein
MLKRLQHSLLYRDVRGLAGYARDLVDISRMQFRNPHGLTKFFLIDGLRRQTRAENFIEAGTFHGTTAARCARTFKRVFTIEIDPDAASRSAEFLEDRGNVSLVQGDALQAIPQVIEAHNLKRIIVFLDGHAALGHPPNGHPPEPALEELEVLSRYQDRLCGVIVDDFRNFGAAAGFPLRSCLVRAAEAFCAQGDFEFTVHLDQLVIRRRTL